MKKRAVFLDRDGTIIKDKHYLNDPEQIELLEGVIEGLRRFGNMGFKLIIVTNQSGIKRGLIEKGNLELIHSRLTHMLKKKDITIDGIYYSPDLPFEQSRTRKPNAGLLELAEKELNISLKDSYCIGDKKEDIEMGQSKEMITILVLTGSGRNNRPKVMPDYIAADMLDAARWISEKEKPKKP